MDVVAEYGAPSASTTSSPLLADVARGRRNHADAARIGLCGPRQWRTRRQASMIDPHPDRHGRTIFRHDDRGLGSMQRRKLAASGRAGASRHPQAGARPDDGLPGDIDAARRVERGTAHRVRNSAHRSRPDRTTNDEKDVWFVGTPRRW
ncbi:hypothetical protein F2981_32325 (plasmid) [Sinorhizobium meliloti]|nr:hypothetical protein [Sinorhizobium meliloti]